MSEDTHPLANLSDETLDAMLKRAMRNTAILGIIAALVLWIASSWRHAAMFLAGAAISAASIYEWQRLIRFVNAKLDRKKTPRSTLAVVIFFVLRLIVFAGVIYVSLKCFQGSVVALLFGLCLAVLAMGWEALQLLRD
jgi:uncharacterized membrane protein